MLHSGRPLVGSHPYFEQDIFSALSMANTSGVYVMLIIFHETEFLGQCYKTFTTAIYCHFMVVLSFCVIKQYCLGYNCGIAVNFYGKLFYNFLPTVVKLNVIVIL